MGQKVHPLGFRLGIYRDWNARWFARESYGKMLLEDFTIRRVLNKALAHAEVAHIDIEKAGNNVRVVIFSARPGLVIGKKGQEIESLRSHVSAQIGKKNVEISVQEIKNPELNAVIVAKGIAEQLTRRGSFKKAMKRAAIEAMRAGAEGIKICCAGRLGGAEIARDEWLRLGSVPLHTLRSDIDYGLAEAKTTYGLIGVKVWICRGGFKVA